VPDKTYTRKLLLWLDQHSPLALVGAHHPFNAFLLPQQVASFSESNCLHGEQGRDLALL